MNERGRIKNLKNSNKILIVIGIIIILVSFVDQMRIFNIIVYMPRLKWVKILHFNNPMPERFLCFSTNFEKSCFF